jgi:hypothetical protein
MNDCQNGPRQQIALLLQIQLLHLSRILQVEYGCQLIGSEVGAVVDQQQLERVEEEELVLGQFAGLELGEEQGDRLGG